MDNLLKKKKVIYWVVSICITACFTILPLCLWVMSGMKYTGITSIRGTSMAPTIENNDILFYQPVKFERGEIVVAKCPSTSKYSASNGVALLKRIVGVPEETVEIVSDGVLVNGKLLDEPYTNNVSKTLQKENDISEIILSYGEYFLLGDNRETSFDSRHVGAFHESSFLYGLTTEPNEYTKMILKNMIMILLINISIVILFWVLLRKIMFGRWKMRQKEELLDANWMNAGPVITSRHFKKKRVGK